MFDFLLGLMFGVGIGYALTCRLKKKKTVVFDYQTYGKGYDDGLEEGYKKGYAECLEDEKHRKIQEEGL